MSDDNYTITHVTWVRYLRGEIGVNGSEEWGAHRSIYNEVAMLMHEASNVPEFIAGVLEDLADAAREYAEFRRLANHPPFIPRSKLSKARYQLKLAEAEPLASEPAAKVRLRRQLYQMNPGEEEVIHGVHVRAMTKFGVTTYMLDYKLQAGDGFDRTDAVERIWGDVEKRSAEERARAELRETLDRLEQEFEDAGGRGVDLAERIDALRAELEEQSDE